MTLPGNADQHAHDQANADNQPERDWFPKQGGAGEPRDGKSQRRENIGLL
jgi:hypothetical protein